VINIGEGTRAHAVATALTRQSYAEAVMPMQPWDVGLLSDPSAWNCPPAADGVGQVAEYCPPPANAFATPREYPRYIGVIQILL